MDSIDIQLLDQTIVSVEIEDGLTIAGLKEKLESQFQLKATNHRLVFEDKPLSIDELVAEFAGKSPIQVESTENKFNFKAFRANTFERLERDITEWLLLVNKRVLTISCWCDADHHYAMIGTNPTEVCIVNSAGYFRADVTSGGALRVQPS